MLLVIDISAVNTEGFNCCISFFPTCFQIYYFLCCLTFISGIHYLIIIIKSFIFLNNIGQYFTVSVVTFFYN